MQNQTKTNKQNNTKSNKTKKTTQNQRTTKKKQLKTKQPQKIRKTIPIPTKTTPKAKAKHDGKKKKKTNQECQQVTLVQHKKTTQSNNLGLAFFVWDENGEDPADPRGASSMAVPKSFFKASDSVT